MSFINLMNIPPQRLLYRPPYFSVKYLVSLSIQYPLLTCSRQFLALFMVAAPNPRNANASSTL